MIQSAMLANTGPAVPGITRDATMEQTISSLSYLALTVWRFALRDNAQTVPELERVLESIGHFALGQDVSSALRELMRAGLAERTIRGFRLRRAEQLTIDTAQQGT